MFSQKIGEGIKKEIITLMSEPCKESPRKKHREIYGVLSRGRIDSTASKPCLKHQDLGCAGQSSQSCADQDELSLVFLEYWVEEALELLR